MSFIIYFKNILKFKLKLLIKSLVNGLPTNDLSFVSKCLLYFFCGAEELKTTNHMQLAWIKMGYQMSKLKFIVEYFFDNLACLTL